MGIKIREWRLEDKKGLSENLSNTRVMDNLRDGLPYPYTEKDAEDYITAMMNADRNSSWSFAITLDDQVIGNIGVYRCENIHSLTAEMGYYIGEPYWGKGYMTEAVRQTCKYVFENSDIVRIFAEPFADNIGSCKVLEKAGFTCEGILRSNAVTNGKILDMKMFALIRSDRK